MKKLSQINETSWGGMVRRSNPEKAIRKQDEFDGETNILRMGEIKINDQIWSLDLLEIQYPDKRGSSLCFSYDDVHSIPPKLFKDWRLPTEDDFLKLHLDGYVYHTSNDDVEIWENEGKQGDHLLFESDFVYMIEENERGDNVVHVEYDEIITARANPKDKDCWINQHSNPKPILVMLIKK